MTRLALLLLVACGPGLASKNQTKVTHETLLGDASKLRDLMRRSVVNGGLRFDDATCMRSFGTPGEVPANRYDDFARCLATLKLEASAREDSLGDVLVVHHAPGFELQARVINDVDGPRLAWIGFASRFQGDPDVPTITHDALETLRLAGERNGPIDPTVAATLEVDEVGPKDGVAYSWFKICLDASGAITKSDPYTTTGSKTVQAFSDAIKANWKFRPFVMRGQPLAVCSLVRMTYPPEKAARLVETLPLPPPPSRSKKRPIVLSSSKLIEGKRIAGDKLIVPDDVEKVAIQKAGSPKLTGRFRVCLDDTGVVESVLPTKSTGLAGYDAKIVRAIWKWRYSPYMIDDQPVPVCTGIVFIYTQSGGSSGRPVKLIR